LVCSVSRFGFAEAKSMARRTWLLTSLSRRTTAVSAATTVAVVVVLAVLATTIVKPTERT
jgi:hypothetical protein